MDLNTGKKTKGPKVMRGDQMTLEQYFQIAKEFQILTDEEAEKYLSRKHKLAPIDHLKEGLEFLGSLYKDKSRHRISPDKIIPGAKNTLDALFGMPSGMSSGVNSFVNKKVMPLKDLRRKQREGL